ncbi:hypothetical protein PR048_003243 [Dryococelus australis]|uniref:Uncharacterized protein n=1 Tax=Dryococelus australis TaxID=614101 RepID=A0ABQ9IMH1_9NEOP|nr:hypothetical protein PR048_003243 [Dryococelus australis]
MQKFLISGTIFQNRAEGSVLDPSRVEEFSNKVLVNHRCLFLSVYTLNVQAGIRADQTSATSLPSLLRSSREAIIVNQELAATRVSASAAGSRHLFERAARVAQETAVTSRALLPQLAIDWPSLSCVTSPGSCNLPRAGGYGSTCLAIRGTCSMGSRRLAPAEGESLRPPPPLPFLTLIRQLRYLRFPALLHRRVTRPLTSHQGDPGSIVGGVSSVFACGNRAGMMPHEVGFSRGSPISPVLTFPVLLHTDLIHPSSSVVKKAVTTHERNKPVLLNSAEVRMILYGLNPRNTLTPALCWGRWSELEDKGIKMRKAGQLLLPLLQAKVFQLAEPSRGTESQLRPWSPPLSRQIHVDEIVRSAPESARWYIEVERYTARKFSPMPKTVSRRESPRAPTPRLSHAWRQFKLSQPPSTPKLWRTSSRQKQILVQSNSKAVLTSQGEPLSVASAAARWEETSRAQYSSDLHRTTKHPRHGVSVFSAAMCGVPCCSKGQRRMVDARSFFSVTPLQRCSHRRFLMVGWGTAHRHVHSRNPTSRHRQQPPPAPQHGWPRRWACSLSHPSDSRLDLGNA